MQNRPQPRRPLWLRPYEPDPGIIFTCALSAPYLANALPFFPRSTGHDLALAVVIALVWGTVFLGDSLGRRFPRAQHAAHTIFRYARIGAVAILYASVFELILTH